MLDILQGVLPWKMASELQVSLSACPPSSAVIRSLRQDEDREAFFLLLRLELHKAPSRPLAMYLTDWLQMRANASGLEARVAQLEQPPPAPPAPPSDEAAQPQLKPGCFRWT